MSFCSKKLSVRGLIAIKIENTIMTIQTLVYFENTRSFSDPVSCSSKRYHKHSTKMNFHLSLFDPFNKSKNSFKSAKNAFFGPHALDWLSFLRVSWIWWKRTTGEAIWRSKLNSAESRRESEYFCFPLLGRGRPPLFGIRINLWKKV